MKRIITTLVVLLSVMVQLSAQNGIIRGNVFDAETGEPILYGTVRLLDTKFGTTTDLDGFFSFGNVPTGNYTLVANYIGYDSTSVNINVAAGKIVYERLQLKQNSIQLTTVDISAKKEKARSEVQISTVTVTPKKIKSLPSTGGEADIAQYLPVLPGIIVSGDQGGQLYIRGGSPIQNKVLLDGMTIYNPFHSIGFFSVFETEAIRSVDVLTGGFNAEYGGRISAIVDIKTREGNKKRMSGLVSASPFQGKALLEGPIKAFDPEKGSSASFLITGKHSWLDQTSKALYSYATDTSFYSFAAQDTSLSAVAGDIGLPYSYSDLYAKLSLVSGNGSKANIFGFNFSDRFQFLGLADLQWKAIGGGTNFVIVPPSSNLIIDGSLAFSNYDITLQEAEGFPRKSAINNYFVNLNFSYYGGNSEIKYGFEFGGVNTDFTFQNALGFSFNQKDFTTELAGYVKAKQTIAGKFIVEPGIRFHYYASQPKLRIEPRIGVKINATDHFRLKFAGGTYSQNLISTVNELDVVNLFVGFLTGPEETIYEPGTKTPTAHRLQTATHAIAGVEIDLSDKISINIEGYQKNFTQLISLNRNKISGEEPDFMTETGNAKGIDFSLSYEGKSFYLWSTYSLGKVNRNDGEQEYPTVFDRRHNINFLATYAFGKDLSWETSLRWNVGSGFPFTQTQGFYESSNFDDLLNTDILTGNYDLGTILSDNRNGGRLPWYHRLDFSLKKTFDLGKYSQLETVFSVTNVYNRENIFYVDRITNNRVNQLPILPSLGMTFRF